MLLTPCLNFLKRYQVLIKSIIWLTLLVIFSYISLIGAFFLIDGSVWQEYQSILSSYSSVFVHMGMLVMILFDRFERGNTVSQSDYETLFLVTVSCCFLFTIYMLASISKQDGYLFLNWIKSGYIVFHIIFLIFLARLRYLIQFQGVPLVQSI